MNETLKIVRLKTDYCDFLRKYDDKVPYNMGSKELRPFVGVLFNVGKCLYFAPLSSPRIKHLKLFDNIDLLKIDNGKLGVINFNNMIPVYEENIESVDLDNKKSLNKEELKYFNLLAKQKYWLSRHDNKLYRKSKFLYDSYIKCTLKENVMKRCCNFPLLEMKCQEYNK